mmetsp:Transcript_14283/g.36364  ORF Transcript_14283/g.36364 Transcript_14283/m.36364 type:complete len:169 (-) Transcript_14283:475-981(-)
MGSEPRYEFDQQPREKWPTDADIDSFVWAAQTLLQGSQIVGGAVLLPTIVTFTLDDVLSSANTSSKERPRSLYRCDALSSESTTLALEASSAERRSHHVMPQEGRANIQYTSSNFVQAALPLIPLFTSFICHATFAKAKSELLCGDTYNISKFLRSKSPSKQIILPPR